MTAYFSTAAAAQRMQVSADLIRDAINDGKLLAKRTSDSPRAPFVTTEEWLDAWFESWVDA